MKILKTVTKIQFESILDDESQEIYKTLSEEKVQEFINRWKQEIEKLIIGEVGGEVTNLDVEIEII